MSLHAYSGTDIYPIYSDHLDTPRLITNQANQKVWEWKTDTFGGQALNEDPSGLGVFNFNLRFPGQYYDAETGLALQLLQGLRSQRREICAE